MHQVYEKRPRTEVQIEGKECSSSHRLDDAWSSTVHPVTVMLTTRKSVELSARRRDRASFFPAEQLRVIVP